MIDSGPAHEHSEVQLLRDLQRFSDAGGALIQVRTREGERAAIAIRRYATEGGNEISEWSTAIGCRSFTTSNYLDNVVKGDECDFATALERPLRRLRDASDPINAAPSGDAPDKVHFFVFVDPQQHLSNNPFALDLLQKYSTILPATNVTIILITPDQPLDMVPQGLLLSTHLPTPSAEELDQILGHLIETSSPENNENSAFSSLDISAEDRKSACVMGLGMTYYEFETYLSLALIKAGEELADQPLTIAPLLQGLAEGKTEVIRQSELLELMKATDIRDVGGMDRLKDWVDQRKNTYTDEAREFGIAPPKGVVLVGVPGVGKSLVAKAVASVLGIPLVRLDFGRVFSKYVGESEQRVRSALAMVESMAPCVLFVDEIDKGLGGIGGGGDSGTSMRVMGSYLTWLQELKSSVFNIVTANRVEGLPPELLRRGRFDQIFSATLPTIEERRAVFEIHLRKRNHDISEFSSADVAEILSRTEGYVPAEIESIVQDSLVAAFSSGSKLKASHVISSIADTVPMSRSNADRINAIIQWASNNAISVNYPPNHSRLAVPKAQSAAPEAGDGTRKRFVRTARRKKA